MSEWKPGDVALIAGMRAMYGGTFGAVPKWQFADSSRCNADAVAVPIDRRLVVIDPEDAEQVERLTDLMGWALHPDDAPRLAAVLRELASLEPRIEEPQGLGAVVEDHGIRYVRWSASDVAPWIASFPKDANRPYRYWDGFEAPIVLSEGVTP